MSRALLYIYIQQATVKPPNIIAHKQSFKFQVQPQTGAYSCLACTFVGTQVGLRSQREILNQAFA